MLSLLLLLRRRDRWRESRNVRLRWLIVCLGGISLFCGEIVPTMRRSRFLRRVRVVRQRRRSASRVAVRKPNPPIL